MNIPYDILAATNCIDKVKAATALFSEGDKEIINVILSRYEREIEKWGNYQVPYYTNTERGAVIAECWIVTGKQSGSCLYFINTVSSC